MTHMSNASARGWNDPERDQLRYWYMPPVAPTPTRLTAGITTTLEKSNIRTTIPSGAANKFIEYAVAALLTDNPMEIRTTDASGGVARFRAFVGAYTGVFPLANATATTFNGIEIGTFGAAPPFPNAPSAPIIQLRRRMNDDNIEFLTAVGDGVTPATVNVYNLGQIVPHGVILELEYTPLVGVSAFVDGQLLETRAFTTPPSSLDILYGVFMTNGTNLNCSYETWWGGCELRYRIPR